MKAFVALASVLAATNAQLVASNLGAYGLATPYAAAPYAAAAYAPYAAAPYATPYAAAVPAALPAAIPSVASTQYHAQDELNQYNFGHASPLSSRQESRDAYGVTQGSYSQIDANGQLQVTNYIADAAGFRVAASNLPVAPVAPAVAPLVAPTFNAVELKAPVMTLEQVADTEEVAAAKAKFFEAYEAEKNREKRSVVPAATTPLALPATYAAAAPWGLPATYAANAWGYAAANPWGYASAFPAATYASALPATYAAAPALPATYAAAPALPAALPATYATAALPATYATAALPAAAVYNTAAPAAEAAIPSVKTTIKLNPGHAISYRVDPVVA